MGEFTTVGLRIEESAHRRIRVHCAQEDIYFREFYARAFRHLCVTRETEPEATYHYLAHPLTGRSLSISVDSDLVTRLQEHVRIDNVRKCNGYYTAIVKYLNQIESEK